MHIRPTDELAGRDSVGLEMKRQIESLRPPMERPSAWSIPKVLHSREACQRDVLVDTTTVFLTGAECPFRCSMCDLWKYTTIERTPDGAIPYQLRQAIAGTELKPKHWLKLYNASNFFDGASVPKCDLSEIARLCEPFERVIVENHPRFCDERMRWFAENISGQLEVAMGLESIHAGAMQWMNKGMTLSDFDQAVEQCRQLQIDVRVFVLLHPPGVPTAESIAWTWKTVSYAIDRRVRHISIIPVRSGNGWVDSLIAKGEYEPPTTELTWAFFEFLKNRTDQIPVSTTIEFDLWDWEKMDGGCTHCKELLREHFVYFNRTQTFPSIDRRSVRCECSF